MRLHARIFNNIRDKRRLLSDSAGPILASFARVVKGGVIQGAGRAARIEGKDPAMIRLIPRKLGQTAIAAAVGLSIAFSPLASAPARAETDAGDILAILLALGLIGVAVDKGTSEPDPYPGPHPHPKPWPHPHPPGPGPYPGPMPPKPEPPKPEPPKPHPVPLSARLLPESCMFDVKTRDGEQRLFSQSCLRQKYRFWDWLPKTCEREIRRGHSHGRLTRIAYSPRCLRYEGFRIDPHR